MLFQNRIFTTDVMPKTNISRMVKLLTVLCISFFFSIGCRTSNPYVNTAKDDLTDMIFIPAGEFVMGNDDTVTYGEYGPQKDESPAHTVYLDAFYIDKYEVTNADFKKFLDANPEYEKERIRQKVNSRLKTQIQWKDKTFPAGKNNHPVSVSWYEAMAYAKWTGKRLPTEAEWEKAARGGLKNKSYPWGDENATYEHANYEINSGTTPVGSYLPNPYGLYDISGNVWEWCLDEYRADFYMKSPDRNPLASKYNIVAITRHYKEVFSPRVLRGGGWVFGPDQLRVSKRYKQPPVESSRSIGFRCVKPVKR